MAVAPRPLAAVVARVRRRLALIAALRLLTSSAPAWLVVLAAAAALRLSGSGVPAPWAAAVPAWLIAAAVWAWWRRPGPAAAAATWDAAAGRADELLNAWWFEQAGTDSPAVRLHHQRVLDALPAWTARLETDLPLALRPLPLTAPLLALLLIGGGVTAPGRPAAPEGLDPEAAARLRTETCRAAETPLPPATGMTDDEKKEADDLRRKLEQASKADTPESQEEALARLDRLAREAERLAEKLTPDTAADLATLRELSRLADLAALAEALQAKDLEKAAKLAEELAERLKSDKTSLDEQRRLAEALRRAAEAAARDQGRLAQALKEADRRMGGGDRAGAGEAFKDLAKDLARQGDRQKAGDRLAALAKQLRGAGARALAQPAGLARLAPAAGLKPFDPKQPLALMPMRPGQGRQGDGKGMIPGAGKEDPKGGGIPIPGGDGQGQGAGDAPVPGSAMAMLMMPGGSQAGHGHLDNSRDPTKAMAATKTGQVQAQIGQGASGETSQVAGAQHRESASVAKAASPSEQLDAEEQALEAEPLPASRRTQVRAYFALVRKGLDPAAKEP